ncbi:MAG: hypothetical protein EHM18_10370 [Acidobacteria bacterium]|nr:MAG: hypothetical protein EHM18_10370 [Acidobacteriota bacterium]
MKVLAGILLLIASVFNPTLGQGDPDPPLEQLLNAKELQEYRSHLKYKDRMEVFADAMKRLSQQLRVLVDQKKVDQIVSNLDLLEALAHYAIKEPAPANKKDRKAGEVRKLEIGLRKLMEDIQDAKTIAPYEYHVEFDKTLEDLGRLRAQLLKNFFGSAIEEPQSTDSSPPNPQSQMSADVLGIAFRFGAATQQSGQQGDTRYSYEITGDQFTDKEYEKIRDNQDLKHRVDAFLEVAEARLAEISRRMNNQEWTEKEPNPLEFYTYEQMVHAYERALNSVMVNIDEKAKYKLATEKDIKKALEKLNKKIMEFTPQLEPIKQLAIKNKDEILYKEVLNAEKTSEIARKGSQYGLGAPVQ